MDVLYYRQDEMTCHLHPILGTWDAVITCTPVTVFFPLVVRLCSKEKKLRKNNATYSATFTVILHKARSIDYHCFSWNSQITFVGLMSACPLTTPTKCQTHKFNYCDLFFAMPSALARLTKVKFEAKCSFLTLCIKCQRH